MTKKLHIKTWGCQMNEYDSSKMADLLDATHGYQLTDVAEEADVLLLNTCSIREKAQEKVFHQLGRWKLLKEKNPDLIIGVGGCVASQEGEHIRQRAHYVDIIFGPQTLHRLPEMINSVRGDRSPVVDISFPEIEKFDRLPEPRAEGPTAFVSIMEGCNKYCTYCVVPYTRGEEVSRPSDDILFEIAQLAAQGVREVNLLGQNVNAWRGENYDGTTGSFADLLRLVAAIDGIDRIRFTTSHPIEFTDDIIEVYRDTPELVSFLHLPVQSGSVAEWAVKTVIEKFAEQFAALSDNYLKERAGDLRALGQRLLFHLDDANQGPNAWPERFILVADELSATTLAELPQDRLVGVVVRDGAANSHAAIMVRALGIPTVMGADIQPSVLHRRTLIVDGYRGELLVDPEPVLLQEYQRLISEEIELSRLAEDDVNLDRKSTRLNSSHIPLSRMPSSA